MQKRKLVAGLFILAGIALVMGAVCFIFTPNATEESGSILKVVGGIFVVLLGSGSSLKGWKDLFKKDVPPPPTTKIESSSDCPPATTGESWLEYLSNQHVEKQVINGKSDQATRRDEKSTNNNRIQIGNVQGPVHTGSGNLNIGTLDYEHMNNAANTLKKLLASIEKRYFKLSISHPKFISKRFESPFIVQLYFEELGFEVKSRIKKMLGDEFDEHIYDSELRFEQTVRIKLYSPDIEFPPPIAKELDKSLNSIVVIGKPLDRCHHGKHQILLSILDAQTDLEYESVIFSVMVADFAFGRISRPLLSKISSVALGIGSLSMIVLTYLEQFDKTIGLTSGTTAGVLAAVVYTNFYNLFQRIRPNTPTS